MDPQIQVALKYVPRIFVQIKFYTTVIIIYLYIYVTIPGIRACMTQDCNHQRYHYAKIEKAERVETDGFKIQLEKPSERKQL